MSSQWHKPMRTLIKGGTVLSMDSEIGDLCRGDVLVHGSVIEDVKPSIDVEDAVILDARGSVVMPGMIDTHRHTWQSTLKVIGTDWLIADYFRFMRSVVGEHYRPEDVYISTFLGAVESINSGVTCLLDWSHIMNTPEHADAAIDALHDSGIRAVFAYGNSNAGFVLPNEICIDERDAERVRDKYFGGPTDMLTMAMALRGPDYSGPDVTRFDFEAARRLGLPITVHIGSNGIRQNSVTQLHEAGLLGPDVTHVHCCVSTDRELEMIRDSGGTVSISPEAESHQGAGFPPLGRLLEKGLRPSLSSDIPSTVGVDMFGQMRSMMAVHRAVEGQQAIDDPGYASPATIGTRDMVEFATIEGARSNHLGDQTGSLTPGKQADVAVISASSPSILPLSNPYGAVVLGAGPADVDTVMIAGKLRKRHGMLLDVDLDRLTARAEASRDFLLGIAGLTPGDFLRQPESVR